MIRRRSTLHPNGRGSAMDTKFGEEVDPDSVGGREGQTLDAALDRYQTFHAKAPIRVAELRHDLPDRWVHVGEALAVMYRTDKWHADGDDEDYKHLHDDGEDKPYSLGHGVKFYEPASEWSKSSIAGKRRGGRAPGARALPVGTPPALTLLGYCLGLFVRLSPEHNVALSEEEYEEARRLIGRAKHDREALEQLNELSIYETNPRGCWLFCSPTGNMLTVYSPQAQSGGYAGFLCAAAGGKLKVLKDGIDG